MRFQVTQIAVRDVAKDRGPLAAGIPISTDPLALVSDPDVDVVVVVAGGTAIESVLRAALAAGKPVVSTSIRDVVRPYGQQGLVRIADEVKPFVDACTAALAEDPASRVRRSDAFLTQTSWDSTWRRIRLHLDEVLRPRKSESAGRTAAGAAFLYS